MCAIIDANVVHQVFSDSPTDAGRQFMEWIDARRSKLVVGGKLTTEIERASERFSAWAKVAWQDGRLDRFGKSEITEAANELHHEGLAVSDDVHILALAKVSRARLLYTNDAKLKQDFQNKKIIDKPRGKLYPMGTSQKACVRRRNLLNRRDLCGTQN